MVKTIKLTRKRLLILILTLLIILLQFDIAANQLAPVHSDSLAGGDSHLFLKGVDLNCLDRVKESVNSSKTLSLVAKDFIGIYLEESRRKLMANSSDLNDDTFESYSPIIFKSDTSVKMALSKSRCTANQNLQSTEGLPRVGLAVITNGLIPNIQEWLMYHLLIGFERIIVFDDTEPGSRRHENFIQTIKPFLDSGRVELNYYDLEPYTFAQDEFYNRVLQDYQQRNNDLDWIAYFDMDEFLLFRHPHSITSFLFSLFTGFHLSTDDGVACVDQFLSNYLNYGSVGFTWVMVSPLSVPLHDPSLTYFDQYKLSIHEPGNSWGKKVVVQVKYMKEVGLHGGTTVSVFRPTVSPEYQPLGFHGGLVESIFTQMRHYGQGDLRHAVLDKACGATAGRLPFQRNRIKQLVSNLESGEVSEFRNDGFLGIDLLRNVMRDALDASLDL